jgi:hypothetical protein
MTKLDSTVAVAVPVAGALIMGYVGKHLLTARAELPTSALAGMMAVCTGLLCAMTCVIVVLMLKMEGGSGSQGGRFFVAIAALMLLGAVDSQYGRLVRRRVPLFSLETTMEQRRYRAVSLVLLLVSAVVLIGLAWCLP